MRILALDTSTSACSVAFWDDGTIRADLFAEMARGQSEHLVPMIQTVLSKCHTQVQEMDMIAVSTGPGAFTGVRIGLATARGLALASGIPIRGVTTLEVVARGVPENERVGHAVLALIDSKRDDIFAQLFQNDHSAVGGPVALAPAEIPAYCRAGNQQDQSLVLAGDAAHRMMAHGFADAEISAVLSSSLHPQATVVAEIAAESGMPGPDELPPSPTYLRPPDVKIRADGGRLRP